MLHKDCDTASARRGARGAEREPAGKLLEGLLHRGKIAMYFLKPDNINTHEQAPQVLDLGLVDHGVGVLR
jgi:hypothetical protein